MRQTSLLAFVSICSELGARQKEVYQLISRNPSSTDYELTLLLGASNPNVVRPRRKELLDKKLIYETGQRECKVTGRTALTWAVV